MKVLVTGGAGFIGSHLVERLVERGEEVIVLDDFSVGRKTNLRSADPGRITLLRRNVADYQAVCSIVKRVDVLYHLAVLCLGMSVVRPRLVHEVNDIGTFNLCMAARKSKLKRFVYVSSSEVYGSAEYVPMDEKHPLNPTTPYGATKAAGEHYIHSFHHTWKLPTVIVRPFNTYGPRARTDRYSAVIPNFVARCLAGKSPVIFGDGRQTRDFTYVSDTVDGILLAANSDELSGEVVNIARGEETSIIELAELIMKSTGKTGVVEPIFVGARPGDVQRHLADISKARRTLSYSPEIPLEEGVMKYINWYCRYSRRTTEKNTRR